MKAEGYFLLARCSHVGEDYSKALELVSYLFIYLFVYLFYFFFSNPSFHLSHPFPSQYRKSVGLNDQNPLALYGLGQMVLRQDSAEALRIFEKVLKMVPDAEETIKVVGYLYSLSRFVFVLMIFSK